MIARSSCEIALKAMHVFQKMSHFGSYFFRN